MDTYMIIKPIFRIEDTDPEFMEFMEFYRRGQMEQTLDSLNTFAREAQLEKGLSFTAEAVDHPSLGEVSKFEFLVASRFYDSDGDFWLGTSDGHYLNLSAYIRDIRSYVEENFPLD